MWVVADARTTEGFNLIKNAMQYVVRNLWSDLTVSSVNYTKGISHILTISKPFSYSCILILNETELIEIDYCYFNIFCYFRMKILYLFIYLFIYHYLPRIASSILLNCYQWGSCLPCETPTKEPCRISSD